MSRLKTSLNLVVDKDILRTGRKVGAITEQFETCGFKLEGDHIDVVDNKRLALLLIFERPLGLHILKQTMVDMLNSSVLFVFLNPFLLFKERSNILILFTILNLCAHWDNRDLNSDI